MRAWETLTSKSMNRERWGRGRGARGFHGASRDITDVMKGRGFARPFDIHPLVSYRFEARLISRALESGVHETAFVSLATLTPRLVVVPEARSKTFTSSLGQLVWRPVEGSGSSKRSAAL